MAHYAFLDENNTVTDIIVGIDEDQIIDGIDPETWYSNFRNQPCKRTSYNAAINGFRKNYAVIGGKYLPEFDAFVSSQPYPSWQINYINFQWEPPLPIPQIDGSQIASWSEENQEWIVSSRQ